MANLTIPAGAVTIRAGDPVLDKICYVAITHGQVIYEDLTQGGKANLADADVQASAYTKGIALADYGAGAWGRFAMPGSRITFAGAVTGAAAGVIYYLSLTAGALAPFADIGSGDYVSAVVLARSTTVFDVLCINGDFTL